MVSRLGMKRKIVFLLRGVIAAFVILISSRVPAQVVGRSLSGKITAVSGTPIPNTHLSIKNITSGNSITATSREDGSYRVSDLSPGNYAVSATATGFVAARASVTIRAEADAKLNFALKADSQPISSSTVSGVVNSQTVRELPLNGRSASD